MTEERSLRLKFFDEVSAPVFTGTRIKGKGGTPMTVALVDEITGQVVKSGPESSAKVEVFLEASNGDDDEHNCCLQNFNNSIIEGDKKKPRLRKGDCISLKDGVGTLCDANLVHCSIWIKKCKCRLGARSVQSFPGIRLQEARTESFMVSDHRNDLYKKKYPPSLKHSVLTLKNIGKGGDPWKCLKEMKVTTVQKFLIYLATNPGRLHKNLLRAGLNDWKATVDHAKTCKINDKRTCLYNDVVFDVVEGLKGVIRDFHYIPDNELSEAEKDEARKKLLSAFENWNYIDFFNDEATLRRQFPRRASYAATNSTIHEDLPGCDQTAISRPCGRSFDNSNYTLSFASPMPAADNSNSTFSFPSRPPAGQMDIDLDSLEPPRDITFFNDEATLQHQFPCRASRAATNSTIHEDLPGCEQTAIFEINNWCRPVEYGTLSECGSSYVRSFGNLNSTFSFSSPMPTASPEPSEFIDLGPLWSFWDELPASPFSEVNNRSETPTAEPHSYQQNNAGESN